MSDQPKWLLRQVYRRGRRRHWLGVYKKTKGCERCGYNEHDVALDFDHLDPDAKLFNPSSRYLNSSLKKIFAEVRKCRVLCANCHRIVTFEAGLFVNRRRDTAQLELPLLHPLDDAVSPDRS